MPEPAPASVVAFAQARAGARARRDWAEADRLRVEIEAAGWKVVDEGLSFSLRPSHAPDVVIAGRTRYGHSSAVPSRLEEPAAGAVTVILLAGEDPAGAAGAIAATLEHAPAGSSVVVVAAAPSADLAAVLEAAEAKAAEARPVETGAADGPGHPIEVVLTSERLGHAALVNAGIRRAGAPVIVILGADVEPAGDVVTPLVRALDDPHVAVAGAPGIATADLRHLREAAAGPADAIGLRCLAFRRADHIERGPLDEHLRTDAYLAVWWSLVLRDEGERSGPRRALAVDLPLVRRDGGEQEPAGDVRAEVTPFDRAGRRDYYRVLERFRGRTDLFGLVTGPVETGRAAD